MPVHESSRAGMDCSSSRSNSSRQNTLIESTGSVRRATTPTIISYASSGIDALNPCIWVVEFVSGRKICGVRPDGAGRLDIASIRHHLEE